MKAKKLRRAMRVNMRKEVSEETTNLLVDQIKMIEKLNKARKVWKYLFIITWLTFATAFTAAWFV